MESNPSAFKIARRRLMKETEYIPNMTDEQKKAAHDHHVKEAAEYLKQLMDRAGLFTFRQERLRKAFFNHTNTGGMRQAVNIEMRQQREESEKFHREHRAEILAAKGIKLENLAPTSERVQ
jgi:hypothetical protein